jgi:phosphoribosylformylglycinamidine cyclo-ligase
VSTYREAGVDIDAGEEAVARLKPHAARTARTGVMGGVGGFGGLFDLASLSPRYTDPVLVSSTDGVGTKALLAAALGRYDTIGFDLVAMCADDLVCTGAEPLFFLDYLVVGAVDPFQIEQLAKGIADACVEIGAALIGGETAEHPGQLADGEFDAAGFCVGVVDRHRLLPQRVEAGNALIGIPSPNLRSNGFSLARRVLLGDAAEAALSSEAWDGRTLGDVLLEPSVLYAPAALALCAAVDVRALAHITGGGMPLKLARVLPDSCDAIVDRTSWESPRVFTEIQQRGDVSDEEMANVFNCGIGMVAVVPQDDVSLALRTLHDAGHPAAREIGVVGPGRGIVRL